MLILGIDLNYNGILKIQKVINRSLLKAFRNKHAKYDYTEFTNSLNNSNPFDSYCQKSM